MLRGVEKGKSAEVLFSDSESGCFYHPGKKAAIVCENCGRFLCALCDIPLGNKHLRPACIESGRKKDKIKDLKKNRILYDEVAVSIAVLPMLFFFITAITGPLSVFYSIWHWKTPGSVVPRSKARFIAAIIIGALQTAGWAAFLIYKLNPHNA